MNSNINYLFLIEDLNQKFMSKTHKLTTSGIPIDDLKDDSKGWVYKNLPKSTLDRMLIVIIKTIFRKFFKIEGKHSSKSQIECQ